MAPLIKSCFAACLIMSVAAEIMSETNPDFEAHYMLGHPVNDSGCGASCSFFEDLGPPPDLILTMPPPPLPSFLHHILIENGTLGFDEDGNCNLCHLFSDNGIDSEFTLKPDLKSSESWMSVIVTAVLTSMIVGAFLLVFLVKCRKWKNSHGGSCIDFCPFLAGGILRSSKAPPPPCSPSDSCISPVVNEKSPQSIIMDAPSKKTSIPSKYWRRGSDFTSDNGAVGHPMMDCPGQGMDDHYTTCTDGGSCTSSPVYAELDGMVTHIPHGQLVGTHHGPVLMASQLATQSISPYSVGLHTYSEVAEAVRMAAMGSSSTLLPDSSYDNAAYLPTASVADHYHTRSLRRGHRAATLAQLGSATPLLSTHQMGQGNAQSVYLTGGRPSKKPRPPFGHHLNRGSTQRMHEELDLTLDQSHAQPRYASRRTHGLYSDLPIHHSPSLSTFKSSSPYSYRDNPKRPLPPVPGVRL